jgi:basic membrane protein A
MDKRETGVYSKEVEMKKDLMKKLAAVLVMMLVLPVLYAGGNRDKGGSQEGQLKVAMLMPGPINDGGWNTQAYTALMEAQKELGVEVAYTDNVAQNDQVQILRQYAMRGFDIMIGHGFQFGDSLIQVGDEYPDKYFLNYGGTAHNGRNVGAISYAYGQTGALIGIMVGMQKDITKAGAIMAFEQATSQQEIFNIERYAKKYNPNIQFVYSYTGDWDDIAKGKEAAIALLNNGCNLNINELSGPAGAVIQAVLEKNAKFIEVTFDAYDMAPNNIISSTCYNANQATIAAIKEVISGNFKGIVYEFGLSDDAIYLGKYGPSVTGAIQTEVEKVKQEIKDGKGDLLILINN